MERLRYPVKEAAGLLGKTRKALYHDIGAGKIKVVRDGRAIFITADELRRYATTDMPSTTAKVEDTLRDEG